MLELDPLLLTGVDDIDRHHREMFQRVGELLDAAKNRRSREEVLRMVEYLDRYVEEHFTAEEREMRGGGYPMADAHVQEHRDFARTLAGVREELAAEGPTVLFVIKVGNRVTEWLRQHVYVTDRRLGEWLRERAR